MKRNFGASTKYSDSRQTLRLVGLLDMTCEESEYDAIIRILINLRSTSSPLMNFKLLLQEAASSELSRRTKITASNYNENLNR